VDFVVVVVCVCLESERDMWDFVVFVVCVCVILKGKTLK
jgi:hypothetical protein